MKVNVCVVCEYGWVLKGEKDKMSTADILMLHNAVVVRCWRNGKGIGGIVKEENKHEYILDPIGDVNVRQNKVLFEMPCEW